MNDLRPGLPPLPPKMAGLAIDKRGYPVPYFVALINGEPDHRIADARAMAACIEHDRCWICGDTLGRFKAFCIGPMCAITRTSSEPPQHVQCARYAATACPFLTRPHAHRREAGRPECAVMPAGEMITRNPGVVCVYVTREHRPFRYGEGTLFDIGDPVSMDWYAEGRDATRAEVNDSITSGLPPLRSMAQQDGPLAVVDLQKRLAGLMNRLDVDLPQETQV
jgi:hypothetical protein